MLLAPYLPHPILTGEMSPMAHQRTGAGVTWARFRGVQAYTMPNV